MTVMFGREKHTGHQSKRAKRGKKTYKKKDKPPGIKHNRIAKFTRTFFRGKFGFFYSVIKQKLLDKIGCTGCRSPPSQSF